MKLLERLAHGRKPEVSRKSLILLLGRQKGDEEIDSEKLRKAAGDQIKERRRKKARRVEGTQNLGKSVR